MTISERVIQATDDKELFARIWTPDHKQPKAVVLIIHGMTEHSGRYKPFAEFLTENEIAAVAYDHRGHGKTDPDQLGITGDEDTFHLMVSDIEYVKKEVKAEFPNLPLFFFSHSMGSFLTQRFMQLYNQPPAGIIYSGSNGRPPFLVYGGLFVSRLISKIKGPEYPSSLIHNLTFGPYNALFKPNRTDHDWLTRDEEQVDKYVNDPHCGFMPSVSFYFDLFSGLQTLHNHKPFTGQYRDTPILIISGDQDPVSYMGEGIERLEKQLKQSGAENLTVKLYKDARHELLNETNREEVLQDILVWLNKMLENRETIRSSTQDTPRN